MTQTQKKHPCRHSMQIHGTQSDDHAGLVTLRATRRHPHRAPLGPAVSVSAGGGRAGQGAYVLALILTGVLSRCAAWALGRPGVGPLGATASLALQGLLLLDSGTDLLLKLTHLLLELANQIDYTLGGGGERGKHKERGECMRGEQQGRSGATEYLMGAGCNLPGTGVFVCPTHSPGGGGRVVTLTPSVTGKRNRMADRAQRLLEVDHGA